jgi:hypothetical protein
MLGYEEAKLSPVIVSIQEEKWERMEGDKRKERCKKKCEGTVLMRRKGEGTKRQLEYFRLVPYV